MTKNTSEIEKLMDTMLALHGIETEEAWRPLILEHLETAAKMADLVAQCTTKTHSLDLANTFMPMLPRHNT